MTVPFCIYPLALLSKSCYDALVLAGHTTPQSNLSYPLERDKGPNIKASRENIVAVQAEEGRAPSAHKWS